MTLISYKGDEMLCLSCLIFKISCGTYRQQIDDDRHDDYFIRLLHCASLIMLDAAGCFAWPLQIAKF